MGVRVDLIDRDVYSSKRTHGERHALFNERDKFLLSERDNLPQIKQRKAETTERNSGPAAADSHQ